MSQSNVTQLANGYRFINGIEMHAELGDRFQVPHRAMKKYDLPKPFNRDGSFTTTLTDEIASPTQVKRAYHGFSMNGKA